MGVKIDSHVQDNLETGDLPSQTYDYQIKEDALFVRGQVLGLVTGTGLLAKYKSGNSDGTENPHSIAVHDAAETVADRAAVYVFGSFNSNKLVFDGADVVADVLEALRDRGIYLKASQPGDAA